MAAGRSTFKLSRTFVHLAPSGDAVSMKVDKAFWAALEGRRIDGRLAGVFRMIRHTSGEMYPDGDELLYLLSGAVDIALEEDGAARIVSMRAGTAYVVPRGTWHRLLVREIGNLLFLTPGPRREHRTARRAPSRSS
jgi:mannose-6-phosphate isomerase-like protein (cupin superfamily)